MKMAKEMKNIRTSTSSHCTDTSWRFPSKNKDIENAFIRLYNKIRINAEKILVPMHEMLLEIREKKHMASEEAKEINKKILEITQQIQVLSNLKTKSIIDSDFYISQTGELEGKIKNLKNKRILLTSLYEDDNMIENTEKLIYILKESPCCIEKFDEELFNKTIEEIIVENEEEIKIKLINGLEIKEKIKKI
ncbi:MAG: hypothetical protein RR064_02170 [Oscillospiraceae bacterium]